VFLNVLVALDGSPSSRKALDEAVDLVRRSNAKLTVITVKPSTAATVPFAGITPEKMSDELTTWADGIQRDAIASLPDDVIAHRVQRRGHAGPEIVKEIERGGYDLVVVGTRGRGRAQEGLLGSVNGYLHFHAKVPLLSVPE
jgi:nucleotide-binding universal stress UspA family protein